MLNIFLFLFEVINLKRKIITVIVALSIVCLKFSNYCNYVAYAQQDTIDKYKLESNLYDEKTDTFRIETKSGTVIVVGGSIATLILTIAVKAGFAFSDSDSMDGFLKEFLGYNATVGFVQSIADLIKETGTGIVTISRSLLDEFCKLYLDLWHSKSQTYLTVQELGIPVIPIGLKSSTLAFKNVVLNANSSVSTVFSKGLSVDVWEYSHRLELPNMHLRFANHGGSLGTHQAAVSLQTKSASMTDSAFSGYTKEFRLNGNKQYAKICYLARPFSDQHEILAGVVFYNNGDTLAQMTGGIISVPYQETWEKQTAQIVEPSIPALPPAVTDRIPGDNDSTSSDLTVGIPSDSNDLIGKSPTDITSQPTYDVWDGSKPIAPPAVDVPTVEFTPELDIPTEKPSNPSIPDVDDPSIPEIGDIPVPKLDLTPLMNNMGDLTERFPFSLPWDLQRIAKSFSGETRAYSVKAPIIKFKLVNQEMTLDFTRFEPIAMIFRGFIFTEVAIGLIYVLRRVKP